MIDLSVMTGSYLYEILVDNDTLLHFKHLIQYPLTQDDPERSATTHLEFIPS